MAAGFKTAETYRYWDPVKRGINLDGIQKSIITVNMTQFTFYWTFRDAC